MALLKPEAVACERTGCYADAKTLHQKLSLTLLDESLSALADVNRAHTGRLPVFWCEVAADGGANGIRRV